MSSASGKSRGRPTYWTDVQYFRLWSYVNYYQTELGQSIRNACRYIAQREPWSNTGLSEGSLRRRFAEAQRRHASGVFGNHLRPDATVDDILSARLDFILDREDLIGMMGPCRWRRAEEEHERLSAEAAYQAYLDECAEAQV